MTFTHLEVHSHFTLLGATASVAELVARAQTDGLTHLALTDTNALYGAVAFARACKEAGIQPIIGMTVTVGPNPPTPFPAREGGETLPSPGRGRVGGGVSGEVWGGGHLVLLATDPAGYRSLCRLSSLIQGRPDREVCAAQGLSWDDIASHREGLICLSGGRMGWIERYLRAGDLASALAYAGRLAGIFDENAYLALELHGPEDESVATEVAAIGRRLGIPTVAVQPVYCLSPDDAPKLRLLAAIRENRRLGDVEDEVEDEDEDEDEAEDEEKVEFSAPRGSATPGRSQRNTGSPTKTAVPQGGCALTDRLGAGVDRTAVTDRLQAGVDAHGVDTHWLSPGEVAARFARFPDAVARTGEIAAHCGDPLPDGRPIWPGLALLAGQTPDEALADLAAQGLQNHCPSPDTQYAARSTQYARLQHELAAIARHGYAPLFLVVADIVRHAREHDIPVSTRGSVANSLVAYCAGITTVDPIEHDLLFERFLNPARANPPDIDLDFCSRRRDEVLAYVREKYGAEHVALVCTMSTLRLHSAVREAGKAYGLDETAVGRLAGMMPGRWHPDPRRRDQRTVADILPRIPDAREREVVRAASALVGQPDHLSVHPGGLVITPGPLTDVVPVQWAPKGFLVTQYEHGDVETIGLPKLDLLGIRALTVLADAAELVRRERDPGFRLDAIPLEDAVTGDMLARGETIGVFQCESEGAQRTLRKLKAHCVRDLAIANAFFKPGPALGGMADAFVRRYRGEEQVRFLHPALAPILGPTKGVLIFQEQVLRLATEIAGLSWAQADRIRRGMSHFGADQIASVEAQFISGCTQPPPDGPGFTPAQARTLWEQIVPFAGYGFNQGHATAYADVSYRSAYLKAHYPAEFFCARLADWGGFHHPAIYAAEATRLGIAVRPPHVNFSGEAFALLRIANCELRTACVPRSRIGSAEPGEHGQSAIENPQSAILHMGLGQIRDLRRSAIAAIVTERANGPFAGLRDLLARVDLQPKEADHLIRCGALDGLGGSRAALLAEAELLGRKGGAAQLAFDFARPEVTAETSAQRLAWEQELLGWPVSVNPLALIADRLPEHTPLDRLAERPGQIVLAAGFRLPGWTGSPGFFLGDGATFVIVRTGRGEKAPPPWHPLLVRGRWTTDTWGGGWLQAAQITPA